MIKRFKEWALSHKRLAISSAIFVLLLTFFIIFFIFGKKYLYHTIEEGIDFLNRKKSLEKEDEVSSEDDTSTKKGEIIAVRDFEFYVLGSPVLVDKKFNLSKPSEDGTDMDDEIKEVYKTADVLKGTYKKDNLKGCEVFVLKYPSWEQVTRIISCDNKKIYRISAYMLEAGDPISGEPEENFVDLIHGYEEDTDLVDEFEDLVFSYLPAYEKNKVSNNGNIFEVHSLSFEMYKKGELIEVDKIDNLPVYNIVSGVSGVSLIPSPEGFYQRLVLVPEIVSFKGKDNDDPEPEVKVKLDNGGTLSAIYDYVSIGSCVNNYLEDIEVVDVKLENLTKIGTGINGDSIYEDTDRRTTYLKKIYYEDYISKDSQLYKVNNIKNDDITPYSYEKFSKSYPVIYWVDPFGRVIKFVRRDFILTVGCGYISPFRENI